MNSSEIQKLFNINEYNIPIDVYVHYIFKFISYYDLDDAFLRMGINRKDAALIKQKIYNLRLTIIKKHDRIEYKIEKYLHREQDLPAVEFTSFNTAYWMYKNKFHRDGDLPAIISYNPNNTRDTSWYKHGNIHRDGDLPAYISDIGGQRWYKNNKLHRDDDLPAIYLNGNKHWYQNGNIHRDGDKPAVILNDGSQYWYKNNIPYTV